MAEAMGVAEELAGWLRPACGRLEIAGSLRRRRPDVGDIELVAVPQFELEKAKFSVDLFGVTNEGPGAFMTNQLWKATDALGVAYAKRGDKYRQFLYRDIQVDFFTATPENWGWQFLVRTGSADFSHDTALRLNKIGYSSKDGTIFRVFDGVSISTPEEEDVFRLLGRVWVPPEDRG